ncbi:hypothetical protein GQ607_015702 [Colletotrichum asianum]|uniref:Uncharacterized protein n=1 Tax=Colletotrichum asianum TaxID=702518 RepID=A0A8H3W2E8_9PEZI|nr:hypothetical protein GQ607_015702 [Colletotrichum asianum]
MLNRLLLLLRAAGHVLPRDGDSADRYTVCGQDRGYTEQDSLEAAQYLTNTVVTSDAFSMAKHDCIFAHVNTTVVSLCNGSQRNRTINRDEARRGIDQLIKDCGLNGGFTGIHVVNNLTFAAYGVGGLSLNPPPGSNPPDVPGSRKRSLGRSLARRDCAWAYDGVPHFDCDAKNRLNEDGSCGGQIVPESNCQAFCELRRTGFLGHEERAPGEGGNQMLPGEAKELGGGFETSISNGFSIGVEGIFTEVIGAGVSYEWSISKTTLTTTTRSMKDVSSEQYSRWVFFPKLIESCGTVSRKTYSAPTPCTGLPCAGLPADDPDCVGDLENVANVCSLVPKLNPDGEPEVFWAVRYEYEDGTPLPFDEQHFSYKTPCVSDDPDGDGEKECYNHIPALMLAPNYKKLEEAIGATNA